MATATFGTTGIGGTLTNSSPSGQSFAVKFTLTENGLVSKVSIYCNHTVAGFFAKAMIWADNGSGYPGSRVALSPAVSVGTSLGWVDFVFSSPVVLAAGTYWIGAIANFSSGTFNHYYDAGGTNQRYFVADNYTTPATTYPGSGTGSNRNYSYYATYTVLVADASITEGGDTLSSGATLAGGPVTGDASITEAADTVAAAGTLALQAAASITEAGDTVTSASALALQAAASITEAGDTINAAGTSGGITADASITEAADTVSGAGTLALQGAAAITEAGDTVTSAAALAIQAAAAITEAADSISSASSGGGRTADAAITEAGDTLLATSIEGWEILAAASGTWTPVTQPSDVLTWDDCTFTWDEWTEPWSYASAWHPEEVEDTTWELVEV